MRCLARSPRKLRGRRWAGIRGSRSWGETRTTGGAAPGHGRLRPAYYLVHSMVAAGPSYAERDRLLAERFAQAAEERRPRAYRLSGRAGGAGGGALRAPRLAPRGGERARLSRHPGDGVARGHDHRLGLGVVRDPALPRGAPARDGHAALGEHEVPADRDPERAALPGGLPRACRRRSGRRSTSAAPTSCPTARSCGSWPRSAGCAAARDPGAGAHAAAQLALDPPRDADLAAHRAAAGRGPAQPVVCRDDLAQRLMPQRLLTVREAIREALDRLDSAEVETTWSMAGPIPGDPDWAGGTVFTDRREVRVAAPPAAVFRAVCRIGGGHGWYAADGLWRLRGALDRLVGGPGLRRGRRDPDQVGLRRGARLLAGHGPRGRPSPRLARGDEAAGRGAARVRGRARGGRHAPRPDRALPAEGPARASPTGTPSCPCTAIVFRGMLRRHPPDRGEPRGEGPAAAA